MRRNNAVRIQEFADDLRNFADNQRPEPQFGSQDVKEEEEKVNKILKNAVIVASLIAKIAKEVEFYVQGDINRKTFLKRYEQLEKQIEAELA